ncbi:MAG: type II secretion system F family protein [bacterium]|nr:type II secretion system F family protein [bacterium]
MPNNLIIMQAILIFALFGIAVWFLRINYTSNVEKRYRKFCIEPLKNNDIPILDRINYIICRIKKILSKILKKSVIFKDYSKKYEKYVDMKNNKKEASIDFISIKFMSSFAFTFLLVLSDVLQFKNFTFIGIITIFLVGFFIPDIYWASKNKIRKNQIEKDMLKAIIIMNNSFKSGLSIMQAIYMVSNELEGPIAEEFKKMYIDISFGLDMDLVFERFSKRVNTEEAHYITTSLSVLNKTGGNIVQVFASVERNAFSRKKLKEELGALSASAQAIYKILVAIPIFLVGIIILLNPSYFSPLFNNTEGRMILGLILVMYISYIIIIRKVVRAGGII